VAIDLRRHAAAAREATRVVRQVLEDAGAYSLLHNATLAVTELVTIAVARSTGDCRLVAWYSEQRGRLRVELTDCEPSPEFTDETELVAEPAQFPFVATLSTEWGVSARQEGKVIWFEMLDCAMSDIPV
jgi:hypothetical protein